MRVFRILLYFVNSHMSLIWHGSSVTLIHHYLVWKLPFLKSSYLEMCVSNAACNSIYVGISSFILVAVMSTCSLHIVHVKIGGSLWSYKSRVHFGVPCVHVTIWTSRNRVLCIQPYVNNTDMFKRLFPECMYWVSDQWWPTSSQAQKGHNTFSLGVSPGWHLVASLCTKWRVNLCDSSWLTSWRMWHYQAGSKTSYRNTVHQSSDSAKGSLSF